LSGCSSFMEDIGQLWQSHLYVGSSKNGNLAVTWFIIFRDIVLFRTANPEMVTTVKQSDLFKEYQWIYILNAILPIQRPILTTFVSYKLSPTFTLLASAKNAKI